MTATTYANVGSNVQSTVYSLLSGDTNVTSLCDHILDGMPKKLSKERGFPYIQINTPSRSDRVFNVINSKFKEEIIVPIAVASYQESVVRTVGDAVINSLKTNQSTTRAAKLSAYRLASANIKPVTLDSGDVTWYYDIRVGYKFIG